MGSAESGQRGEVEPVRSLGKSAAGGGLRTGRKSGRPKSGLRALETEGQRPGGGRVAPEVRRTERIALQVTRGELRDLEAIALGWDVPLSVACYAVVADGLARCRSRAANLGGIGATIAAADAVLRRQLRSSLSDLAAEVRRAVDAGERAVIALEATPNGIRVVVEPPELSP